MNTQVLKTKGVLFLLADFVDAIVRHMDAENLREYLAIQYQIDTLFNRLRFSISYQQSSVLVFLIGWTILAILGCGGNTDEPAPPTSDDLMLKEKLIGAWDVVSVNDIEPSRFLTILMVKASNIEIDDEGRLTLIVPGSARGKMRLEKRDATLPQG